MISVASETGTGVVTAPPTFEVEGHSPPFCDVTHGMYTDVGNRTRHYIYTDKAKLATYMHPESASDEILAVSRVSPASSLLRGGA